jgi:methylase of polypeptide subunit release factors
VEPRELGSLQPEVREWEPQEALVGEGMTEAIMRSARDVLKHGGWLVLEVGEGTADAVCRLLAGLGYVDVRPSPDLAGRDRVVEGRWT